MRGFGAPPVISVLASKRGGLPDIVDAGGLLIDLPRRLAPESALPPHSAEVEPWVDAIIRVWDDAALYGELSREAFRSGLQWNAGRVMSAYTQFFRNLTVQPGPPFVPRGGDGAGGPMRAT